MIAAPVKAGRSPVATLQRWLRAAGISIHWGADGRQLLRNKFALYFEYRVAVSLAFIEPGDHLLYGASGEPHHPGDVGGVHAVFYGRSVRACSAHRPHLEIYPSKGFVP